jgi:hypothetical protein
VLNQYPFAIQPEGILMCINEGFCVTQLGNSQFFTAVLSRESVLDAKSEHPVNVVDETMYARTVGGRLSSTHIGKYVKSMMRGVSKMKKGEEEGGRHSKSKLKHLLH